MGNGPSLELGHRLGSGGEADVFAIRGDSLRVAKVYRNADHQKEAKLRAMLAEPPSDPTAQAGHISIAWPLELVLDSTNKVIGFLMPAIDGAKSVPLFKLYNPADRGEVAPEFTWEYLLRTARNLSSVVDALHGKGYVVGDLNESNLLVANNALVTVIDCDSMQVTSNGQVFRCPVGKPEYSAPELQGVDFATVDRRPSHDAFGLGVLIFLLLMEGVHPFAGVSRRSGQPPTLADNIRSGQCPYLPLATLKPPPYALPFKSLPGGLQKLFIRCFGDGNSQPEARPGANEWHAALEDAEHHLTRCAKNERHVYSDHLRSCPWCARIAKGLPDPFPVRGRQFALPPVNFSPPPSPSPKRTPPRAIPRAAATPVPPASSRPRNWAWVWVVGILALVIGGPALARAASGPQTQSPARPPTSASAAARASGVGSVGALASPNVFLDRSVSVSPSAPTSSPSKPTAVSTEVPTVAPTPAPSNTPRPTNTPLPAKTPTPRFSTGIPRQNLESSYVTSGVVADYSRSQLETESKSLSDDQLRTATARFNRESSFITSGVVADYSRTSLDNLVRTLSDQQLEAYTQRFNLESSYITSAVVNGQPRQQADAFAHQATNAQLQGR